MTSQLLYIIHSAEDKALAKFVKSECEGNVAGLRAFLASKAGQIPTGADWLAEVHGNLSAATKYLLLLTPRSITRHWVWYEAGAAWRSRLPRFPVAAAGLNRNDIPPPLGAAHTLALDDPEDAAQLFVDLGGTLDDPDAFCTAARALALPLLSNQLDDKRIREVRQAFGELGPPPKLLLRRMLTSGTLTLEEMASELKNATFVHDTVSVKRMRDVLKNYNLVEGDAEGRWSVRSDVRDTLQGCFNPPLSKRLMDLAQGMLAWVDGNNGLIDLNAFQQKFQTELNLLRDKAERDHSEGDEWLSKLPSSAGGVRGIADALVRVAQRVP